MDKLKLWCVYMGIHGEYYENLIYSIFMAYSDRNVVVYSFEWCTHSDKCHLIYTQYLKIYKCGYNYIVKVK